jgi:hypothetical protein
VRRAPFARVPNSLLAAAAVGLLTLCAVLLLTGVPAVTTLLLVACVGWQAIAGAVVWRWLRPVASPLEVAGASLAVGTAFAALAGLLTSTIGLGPWGWLVPSALAVVIRMADRQRSGKARGSASTGVDRPALWGLLAGVVPGLAVLAYALRSYPLTWTGAWTGYHPDMPFFEALATSLARFGAFESPFMTDGVVRYHWLSYAWAGQLTVAADAAPFVTITRVLPVVALLGCAAMVAAWTRTLSSQAWTPALAGLLLSIGGFTGAVFGGVLTMDSPSQSMSVLWLIAFAIAVVHVTTSQVRLLPAVALVGTLSLALIGGKVSAAAPAVAAAIVMVGVQVIRGDVPRARALWTLAATVLGAAVGFALFLSGSVGGGGLTLGSLIDKASSQQGLNPIDGMRGVVLGTLVLALAVAARWAGLGWLLTRRQWRWRPEVTLAAGLAGSSLLALVAFNSFNEVWFSSTVSGPLAVITALGAGVALDDLRSRERPTRGPLLLAASFGALLIVIAVWLLWLTGASGGNLFVPTARWFGPIAAWLLALAIGVGLSWWARGRPSLRTAVAGGVVVLVLASVPGRLLGAGTDQVAQQSNGIRAEWFSFSEVTPTSGLDTAEQFEWTSTRLDAARNLRDAAGSSDIVATNVTLLPFVAGVTGLPTYVSGILYQEPYGPPWMSAELFEREKQSWAFIDAPSQTTVQPLCEADVRWLWIDPAKTQTRSWEPWATTEITKPDVIVARLNPAACP